MGPIERGVERRLAGYIDRLARGNQEAALRLGATSLLVLLSDIPLVTPEDVDDAIDPAVPGQRGGAHLARIAHPHH